MKLELFDDDGNYIPNLNEPKLLEGEPMEIYSGHEGKDRVCCNCEHNKRMPKSTYVRCICDIDGHYIGYVQCFDNWCRHWAKEESR